MIRGSRRNGPLTFIPGSHTKGVLAGTMLDGMPVGYDDAPAWVSTLTADEKYAIDRDVIRTIAGSSGLTSPKGPAGSVLYFHPNILHASAQNISPFGRTTFIVVYNGVSNPPGNVEQPRPDFLASRDATPVAVG